MVRIVPVKEITGGMFLAQNIYRHDSLLSLPKGVNITKFEKQIIQNHQFEYILVEDTKYKKKKNDIHLTLSIIESAYKQTTLWSRSFGEEMFDGLRKRIIKNKKVQKYLNQLREIDSYSFVHCVNISIIVAVLLAIDKKVDKELVNLAYISLLHDVGRIKIKKIFNKEGKLTTEEFNELRKHPIYSCQLLKKAGFHDVELQSVAQHHERYDGTGYPERIKKEEISDLAQLILIGDVYNGLSSFRPYREAYSTNDVVLMISEEKNKTFGERYVEFFLKKFSPYQIGTVVELNDGSVAVVKYLNPNRQLLPVVEIINENIQKPIAVNLAHQKDLHIKRIMQTY